MNICVGPECPECGKTEHFVQSYIRDADGYDVGLELVCRACEHWWEDTWNS